MSALCGIFYLDGRLSNVTDLEQMLDRLAHRGPDDQSKWSQQSVGLGQRVLWTTPESLKERLPLQQHNRVIVADARLDNRPELLALLRLNPDCGDSAIILAAYERWGENCAVHLIGEFVFVIWDAQKEQLFCARDHMGFKPFYYYRSGRVFAFASEIKALFTLADVPQSLNELQIAYHLSGSIIDASITLYEDIYRLPPAHTLTVSHAGVRLQRYWKLDPSVELNLKSDTDYIEAFTQAFQEAVRCRVRSAFPVGSTLSGGLDSSSIACLAGQFLSGPGSPGRLHSFTAIFPDLPAADRKIIDEQHYVDAVLNRNDFDAHYIRASELSPLNDLDRLFWHFDALFLAPNMYIHWALYRAAHDAGVRILLDGIDGDTTISHGWEYLTELAGSGRWIKLVDEVTAYVRNTGYPLSRRKLIWQHGFSPLIPRTFAASWRRLRGEPTAPLWEGQAISPEFARRTQLDERLREFDAEQAKRGRTARHRHMATMESPLYAAALELANQAAAGLSVEPRYPFFDRRLMEFCLSLPASQKFSQGWPRAILRRAMSGILPDELRWRAAKSDLSPNFTRGLLLRERDTLHAFITQPGAAESYLHMPVIQGAYQRFTEGKSYTKQDLTVLYCALTLWLWLSETRRFKN